MAGKERPSKTVLSGVDCLSKEIGVQHVTRRWGIPSSVLGTALNDHWRWAKQESLEAALLLRAAYAQAAQAVIPSQAEMGTLEIITDFLIFADLIMSSTQLSLLRETIRAHSSVLDKKLPEKLCAASCNLDLGEEILVLASQSFSDCRGRSGNLNWERGYRPFLRIVGVGQPELYFHLPLGLKVDGSSTASVRVTEFLLPKIGKQIAETVLQSRATKSKTRYFHASGPRLVWAGFLELMDRKSSSSHGEKQSVADEAGKGLDGLRQAFLSGLMLEDRAAVLEKLRPMVRCVRKPLLLRP